MAIDQILLILILMQSGKSLPIALESWTNSIGLITTIQKEMYPHRSSKFFLYYYSKLRKTKINLIFGMPLINPPG